MRYHAQEMMQTGLQPKYSLPVHPTQIYSFAANILIMLRSIKFCNCVKIKGQLFGLYLMFMESGD